MVKRPRTEGKSEEDARFFVNIHCNLKVFLFSISRPTIMSDVVYGEFSESVTASDLPARRGIATDRRALRFGKQGGHQAARCRKRQPQSWNCSIAGKVNQVSAECGREAAKNGGCQAIGQSKSGGSDVDRHDFCECYDHGSVITAKNEREPEFDH